MKFKIKRIRYKIKFHNIDSIKYIEIKDTKELNFKFKICNQNTGPPVYTLLYTYCFVSIYRIKKVYILFYTGEKYINNDAE